MRTAAVRPGFRIALTVVLFLAALGFTASPPALAGPPALAQADGNLKWSASIAGRPTEEIDSNRPLLLRGNEVAVVLDLENLSSQQLQVRGVRLNGRVMGMSFFSFTVRIDAVLGPHRRTTRKFNMDLDELSDQAVGFIPSSFQILNPARKVIAEATFPVDVRGSALSLYGWFGIIVGLLTLALLGSLLVTVYYRRLSGSNRWQRAVQFLPVGAGVGLTLTFTLSALRLLIPSAPAWLSVVLISAAVAFVIGYFMPLGRDDEHDDEHDDVDGQPARSEEDRRGWPFWPDDSAQQDLGRVP